MQAAHLNTGTIDLRPRSQVSIAETLEEADAIVTSRAKVKVRG
jgi:hypothetical protein